ncbi:MAG: sensor domain-containing diguanylate cyclase, partial [Burkholderiales bacterium]
MGVNGRGLFARIVSRIGPTAPAFFVLALGLAISFAAWRFTQERVNAEIAGEFQQKTSRGVETVDRRVQDTVNLLLGIKGLFSASDHVDRGDFQRYLSGFHLERRYAVIRVLSFSRYLTHAERPAFEKRLRGEVSAHAGVKPGPLIKPPGSRDDYIVIDYIEPLAGNEAAFGIDLAANPVRRAEILHARDSGEPEASPPLEVAINPNHVSIALRMAVYRHGMPLDTLEQRRKAFLGVVGSVIHVDDLMMSLFGTQLSNDFELVVHDVGPWAGTQSEAPSRRNLLYDSRWLGGAGAGVEGGQFRQVSMIDVAGRKWRLSFGLPVGVRGAERTLPMVVLTGSVLASLLLFWVVWALLISRERALKLAEHATAARTTEDLREQLSFIQQLIEAVPQPIFFKDTDGRYLGVNSAWERFFGIPREKFIGKSVFELFPHNQDLARRHHAKDQELFNAPGSQTYEAAIVAADTRMHHTIYNKATFNKSDATVAGLIGTITDVSELKEAESALREGEARFRDLTELSSDWYWEQDADLRFTQISSKVHEFSLGAEEDIGKTRWEVPRLQMTEEQWRQHKAALAARRAFQDFVYQRLDIHGNLRTISVSGRPIFDEEGRFQGYRGTGRDITEQKRAEEQIRHMAQHDALTELPNRMLLHDRIGQAIAQAQRNRGVLALLFIDLDRFKTVNDSLGHPVGDRLLKTVAERLGTSTRGSDTIARIGGDEFVVLLSG